MGYSDLIDRLLDTRINEGMLSTLGDKGIKSLLKALDKGDAKQLKGSNIRIDTHYFNNSPFSRDLLPYVVSGEELPSIRGKDYNIYHLSCKGEDYIVVFEYANQIDEDVLYITFNFKDAETCKRIYTLICENRIRSNQLYSLYFSGNTDIGLEFYV